MTNGTRALRILVACAGGVLAGGRGFEKKSGTRGRRPGAAIGRTARHGTVRIPPVTAKVRVTRPGGAVTTSSLSGITSPTTGRESSAASSGPRVSG
jgi:hypothetical protein